MATKGMKFHRHRCDNCRAIWRHASIPANRGNYHAHLCPKCGEYQPQVHTFDRSPKSIRGVRKVIKRALAHALTSNLKNVIYTQFSSCGDDVNLVSSHGQLTITMRYPYKPSRKSR